MPRPEVGAPHRLSGPRPSFIDAQRRNGRKADGAPFKATWRSGYATVCKTVYPGSIPGVASNKIKCLEG
jgi:hypothetical protein